jgi:hypothetical protein
MNSQTQMNCQTIRAGRGRLRIVTIRVYHRVPGFSQMIVTQM